VTGETPFAGGDPDEVMARHRDEAVVPPSLRRPNFDVPVELERIILQALAKAPEARFPDAAAFASALREAAPALGPARGRQRTVTMPPGPSTLEARTRRWAAPPDRAPRLARERLARGTAEPPDGATADELARERLGRAIASGDLDAIAAGYLILSRALVSASRTTDAMRELEECVDILTGGAGHEAAAAPGPTWQVLAALASLHDAIGSRGAALGYAAAAHRHAVGSRSIIGRDRTRAIIDRLMRLRRS